MIQYGFHGLSQIRANCYGSIISWVRRIAFFRNRLNVCNFPTWRKFSDEEHNFKTRAGIPSGPENFLISRFASTLLTSLVHMWTSDIVHKARGVKVSGWSVSEINEFLENVSARILAFSTECGKVLPFLIKRGKDKVSALFSVLTKDQKFLMPML